MAAGQCEYDIKKPELDRAEQDMNQLWESTVLAIRQMLDEKPGIKDQIGGIGFSGQMHGLVMVDQDIRPIGNAIIWRISGQESRFPISMKLFRKKSLEGCLKTG